MENKPLISVIFQYIMYRNMLESQLKVFYSRLIKILKLYWWMMAHR